MTPDSNYQRCPGCGFLYASLPPTCPRCRHVFFVQPLSDRQLLWRKIVLYGFNVPALVIAALVPSYIGTFLIDLVLAGPKVETGGVLGEHTEKTVVTWIMITLNAACAFWIYGFLIRRQDVMRLWENDPATEEIVSRSIAIEIALFVVIEGVLIHVWAGS